VATSTITVERIHRLIDEAVRVGTIERVTFTGGEATLLGRELDDLIAHAHGARFATRLISNAYWAVSERAAKARIQALRRAGLDEIMFSTGTFHQTYVPVERVIRAARSSFTNGLPARISVEDCDQVTFDDAVLHEELADAVASGMLRIVRDPWITDAGRRGSTPLTHDRLRGRGDVPSAGGCAAILTTVTVTPEMELVACCGFPLEQLPGLRIGTVADEPLDAVLARAPNDLLKIFLHVLGPVGIAQFVARYEPGYVLPSNPASICDACTMLQRDRHAMAIAAQHAHEIADDIVARFVASQYASSAGKLTAQL
jgi:hypothetical protein